MNRITNKDLERRVKYLNQLTNNPTERFTVDKDKKLTSNVGHYYIAGAYGGVELHQIVNKGGGVNDVLRTGYTTKRDLYNNINSFITGLLHPY